jgi:hypothetical protein
MTGRGDGAIVIIAASIPVMAYRLFRSYLRVKVSAKKASKVFYQSLLANGLPKREARALRDEYGAGMSITALIRELTFNSR